MMNGWITDDELMMNNEWIKKGWINDEWMNKWWMYDKCMMNE